MQHAIVDEIDLQIIRLLARDSRTHYKDIASAVGISTNAAKARINRDFHISYNTSSWLITMYLLAGAVMTPIAGKLSDIHGRKKILLIIMIIYTIGVSIAASSNTFYIIANGHCKLLFER